MATVRFEPGLDNVMVVTGSDAYGMTREALTAFLHSESTRPKVYREGLYDFAALWWDGKSGANHRGDDPAATPRPMRGRLFLGGVPSSSANLAGGLYLLAHEVFHHWMVSSSITVRGQKAMDWQGFVASATGGQTRYVNPPLLGRGNSHWGPYWQSDDSFMDGTEFAVGPKVGFLRRWDAIQQPSITIDAPDGQTITTTTQYSDLDLFGMGAKPAAECYPDDDGRFRWMEPRYVGPIPHRIGVMVALRNEAGATTTYEFGYDSHYDEVVVARDGGVQVQRNVPGFDPFTFDRGLLFRVVRRGGSLDFQARKDPRGAAGCRRLLQTLITRRRPLEDRFDPLAELAVSGSGDFSDWETVHTVAQKGNEEVVIGLSAQRSGAAWVDLSFRDVHMMSLDGGGRRESLDVPSGTPDTSLGAWLSAWDSWTEFTGRIFLPSPGAQVRAETDGTTHLMLPHRIPNAANSFPAASFAFDPPGTDGGARILWKAPSGQFAFVASAAPHAVLVAPWIGGGMNGKYLLGVEHRDLVSDVTFRPGHAAKRIPPPGDAYRIAHIIVGDTDADITRQKVEAVDLRRRAFDVFFEAATEGRRRMNSSLEDA